MPVYKPERSPFWYIDIVDPRTGERIRESSKRKIKKEAEGVAASRQKELLDQHQLGYSKEGTLGAALDRLVEMDKAANKTWDRAQIVRKILGEGESNKGRFKLDRSLALHLLTQRDLNDLKVARQSEGNAPGTINLELKVILRALNVAADEGFRVPVRLKVQKFKTKAKWRHLSLEEEDRLLVELDPRREIRWKDRFGNEGRTGDVSAVVRRQMVDAIDLAVFLLDTGARLNEVSTITWDAVDTLRWVWVGIHRSKVDNTGTLAMTPRLRAILQRRWAERRNSYYIFTGYGEDGDDAPRGKSTKAIRKAIARAKLNPEHLVKKFGKVTAHTFRDTFATRLRRAGVGLDELKQLLGHSDIRQTMKYATIDAEGTALRAAETLGAIHADRAARQFVPSQPRETPVISPEVRGKSATHSEEGNADVASTFDVTFWNSLGNLVGAAGFEPTTPRPPV